MCVGVIISHMTLSDTHSALETILDRESRARDFRFDVDALLDESKAATLLDVTPRALQAWRQRGGGPPYVRISSRCVRYRRRDLVAFAEARLQRSTSDTSGLSK
jgi:hypothetical protein